VNDVGPASRSYFGGRSDARARSTVDRPIPSCRATCRRGTPSATSRLINAQSSTEITHPICLGGLVFNRRYGLVFERRRQKVHGIWRGLTEEERNQETRARKADPVNASSG
jgi:hypothetical protein